MKRIILFLITLAAVLCIFSGCVDKAKDSAMSSPGLSVSVDRDSLKVVGKAGSNIIGDDE